MGWGCEKTKMTKEQRGNDGHEIKTQRGDKFPILLFLFGRFYPLISGATQGQFGKFVLHSSN